MIVPWTARRSNHSILKEINPGISLEGMILKLKLQYFGHIMQRVDSLEKLMLKLKLHYFDHLMQRANSLEKIDPGKD